MACEPNATGYCECGESGSEVHESAVHWSTANGILEYAFSSDFGITFQKGSGLELVAFADAGYASKATDRRSVSGGAVMCAGACVCWFSRTQKCVTLSTTEAEYVALGDTVKEAIFIRYVGSPTGAMMTLWAFGTRAQEEKQDKRREK